MLVRTMAPAQKATKLELIGIGANFYYYYDHLCRLTMNKLFLQRLLCVS